MKVTIFTGNQPRHIALINRIAAISDNVFAVMECNTVFPGSVEDFYKKSQVMRQYFANVLEAEKKFFGNISFSTDNVRVMALKGGDLNLIEYSQLSQALKSEIYIIFGSSYIKGWLIDFLVERKAINIHMGVSPFYRGASCNFWAMYDNHPEMVGSTIHLLSKGLDSGPILYHALPIFDNQQPFDFTMSAVRAAQESLTQKLSSGDLLNMSPVLQNKLDEIRYTRNLDFTDDVASSFLKRDFDSKKIQKLIEEYPISKLIRPEYV